MSIPAFPPNQQHRNLQLKLNSQLNKIQLSSFEIFPWQSYAQGPCVGIDEVGRGCLAGPVYAGAVIIPDSAVEILKSAGVTDSKKISEKKRSELAQIIFETCLVGLGFASSVEIDRINILQATFLAMRRALLSLSSKTGFNDGYLLIDGNQKIPFSGLQFEASTSVSEQEEFLQFRALPQVTLVKGDLRALPVAAASIVAKVTRDTLMSELDQEYPEYGFKGHKGYAAKTHQNAIKEYGPTPVHRRTFGGVKEYC